MNDASESLQTAPGRQPVCFVIMPISDVEPYQKGHFRRVYEHLIRPACVLAGMQPIRVDDSLQSGHIVLEILRQLLEADMAICDLSSRNPNVFYELGVRQAFEKPVCLIKDSRTERVFDIQGLRDIEYDESLRIDTVEQVISQIARSLTETLSAQRSSGEAQVGSFVQLLGLRAAALPRPTEVSAETSLLLDSISELSSRFAMLEESVRRAAAPRGDYRINSTPQSIGEALEQHDHRLRRKSHLELARLYESGTRVRSLKFGDGTVAELDVRGPEPKVRIDFDDEAVGRKTMVLSRAQLDVIGLDGL